MAEKTMQEHIESGAKYSGSSVTVGSAVAILIAYFFPGLRADLEAFAAVQGLCIFLANLGFTYVWKS